MPRYEKEVMLSELKGCLKDNSLIFFSAVNGLKVEEMNELRRALETKTNRALIVKNSIAEKALKDAGFNGEVSKYLKDVVLITFGDKEPQDISKAFVDFSKNHEKLSLRGAILDGKVVALEEVKELAKLPSREVLLGKVVGGINAPISGFVLTLSGLLRSFVSVLNQVAEKKK